MSLSDWGWSVPFSSFFALEPGLDTEPARVIDQQRGRARLAFAWGEGPAEAAGRLARQGPMPVIGDWVVVRGRQRIDAVLPRRTRFERVEPGGGGGVQVLAANMDQVAVITGLDQDFNPRRLERYVVQVAESGARLVIVLNKSDLRPRPGQALIEAQAVAAGAPVLLVSAASGAGMEEFSSFLAPGETTALTGSSGAGKSSLINRLTGQALATAPVREHDSRGRHTTVGRQLFRLPGGALIMDLPGIRELGVLASAEDPLSEAFADIEALAAGCRFRDCAHAMEPGCAVRSGVDEERLASFHKLRRELAFRRGRNRLR